MTSLATYSMSPYKDITDEEINSAEFKEFSNFYYYDFMVLEDIYQNGEMFKIERNMDLKIKKNLDDTQKEYFLREKMKLIKEELGEQSLKEDEIEELKLKVSKLKCNDDIKKRK